jgi:hypothetical protein
MVPIYLVPISRSCTVVGWTQTVYLEKCPVDRALSTQAKTNIITILFIRNTLQEVDRLIKMLYWLICFFTNLILKVKTGPQRLLNL